MKCHVDPVLLEWPSFNYKEKPLFEDPISLKVYPVETIFAEKLETLISRGAGAYAGALFYSLIATAKANGLNPFDYLKLLFENIRFCKTPEDYKALLPFNSKSH